jgi:hypothetical protein
MLHALTAIGPVPPHERELAQFGRFIGSWDLDVRYYTDDGSVRRHVAGEWHFGWVLEGRAIMDVWTVPPRVERVAAAPAEPPGEYGATLRFYDPRIGAWRSTWHGPVHGVVWPFIARPAGDAPGDGPRDAMVLERTDEAGALVRWIFSDLEPDPAAPDAFRWRAVESMDGGTTWLLRQTMIATRRGSVSARVEDALTR